MTEKEQDFLEVDAQVRGQEYCCISFVSPEDILAKKEVFYFEKYIKNISTRYSKIEEALNKYVPKDELGPLRIEEFSMDGKELENRYKDFIYVNSDKLESEFYEKNDFRTTVRGVKVRGSYDTLAEAQARAKKLQQMDKNFNVYIGQVGYWLPWDPNPHKIDNQEYGEKELNTLVKKYRENQDKKDQHFRDNIDYARECAEKQKAKKEESEKQTIQSEEGQDVTEDVTDKVVNTDEDTVVNTDSGVSSETTESIFKGDDSTLKTSLEGSDPWLDRKQ